MKFPKITKALETIKAQQLKEASKKVAQIADILAIDSRDWDEFKSKEGSTLYFAKCLTPRQRQKPINEIKDILLKKETAAINKAFTEIFAKLENYENASPAKVVELSIDWTTGSVDGWQAKASVWVSTTANTSRSTEGRKTGGGGYDKRSTTSANAFNQSPEILALICEKLEKKSQKYITDTLGGKKGDARDFLGYGLNFFLLPSFAGGVGIESHQMIFEALGFKTTAQHSSKFNDFYVFEKRGGAC